MNPIKCDDCIFLGRRHEKGVIPIQSGALPIEEPYVTCTLRQYFVLEREVDKCQDYKNKNSYEISKKDVPIKNPFDSDDIINATNNMDWFNIQDIIKKLNLESKHEIHYIVLILKKMSKKGQLGFKIDKGKQYWKLK